MNQSQPLATDSAKTTSPSPSESLHQSEQKFRLLFETMPLGVMYQDADGYVTDANPAAQRILGLTLEQLQDHTFKDMPWQAIYEDGSEFPYKTHPAIVALQTGQPVSNVVMGVFNPVIEAYRWLNINAIPHFKPDETAPYEVHTIFEDVTERKKAEETLRAEQLRFAKVATAIPGVICTFWLRLDGVLCIPYASRAFEDIYGLTLADVAENINALIARVPPEQVTSLVEGVSESARTLQPWRHEYSYRHPVKGDIWIEGFSMPVREVDGSTVWYGFATDITERKRTEFIVQDIRRKSEDALTAARAAYWEFDIHSGMFTFNERFYALHGITDASGLQMSQDEFCRKYVHPDFLPQVSETIRQAIESKDANLHLEVDGKLIRSNGQIYWINTNVWTEKDPQGNTIKLRGVNQDITERKRIEEAMRESNKSFTQMADNIQEVFWMFDNLQQRIIYISPAYKKIWGRAVADVYQDSRHYIEAIHPDDRGIMLAVLERQARGEKTKIEYRVVRPNGSIRWIYDRSFPILDENGVVVRTTGIAADITERKQAEMALRRSEENLKYAQAVAHVGSWVLHLASNDLEWSDETYRIFGVPLGKKLGLNDFFACIHPEDQPKVAAAWNAPLTGAPYDIEHRIVLADGQVRWVREIAALTFSPAGEPLSGFGTVQDITERKQAEIALRLSEEQYRGLMESLDSVVATVDYEGRFLYLNEVAAQQLGSTVAELTGKCMLDLFPEAVASRQLENIRTVIREDREIVNEALSFTQSGPRWYRTSMQPIHDESGRVIYALVNATDIHNLKTAQQELLELNRTLEERVKERTAEVQDLYENAPTGYHSLDENGIFTLVNQTELNWLGYSREEVVGVKNFYDLVTPSSQQIFTKTFPLLKNKGWVKDLEFDLVRKDGTILPVLLNATAVYDVDGRFLQSRSTILDITERKKAETALRESEEQNRLLFEESPDAIVLFDEAGRVAQMNRAFEMMTGYTARQLAGHTLDEMGLVAREQIEQLGVAAPQHLQGQRSLAAAEFRLNRANGESCDVGARVFALKIRGRQHYLSTMRDITLQKQAEETLRRANYELARAARAKDEFLATMSHELRTPLNAILGLSEALQEQIRGPLNEYQQESLRNIEASGRHLLTLINDILDLSKVEAGRLELQIQPISAVDTCRASMLFVKNMALKKQIHLTFQLNDQLTVIEADPKRLKQMLVNLLSNAVKFTPAGGQVSLNVTADAEAGVIYFAVQDTGIGIAPEDVARLFQPFTQLDSRLSRQYEGSGLGLALVRRLADLHGGSVTVESEVGRGSRFTIVLPYSSPQMVKAEPQTEIASPPPVVIDAARLAGRRILLAEDNEANIMTMEDYLKGKGYQVIVARDGQQALDQAEAVRPDLILMDIQMPVMDGLEATRRLRASPQFAATPIIALTALAMPGDRERCVEAGVSAYVTKPVSLKGLTEKITSLLQQ